MYGHSTTSFLTKCVFFWNTNHLPRTSDTVVFGSGRMNVIPFEYRIPDNEQDTGLTAALTTEQGKSAVLNWLLDGAAKFKPGCFNTRPARIQKASEEYRITNCKHEAFFYERVEITSSDKDRIADALMYNQFEMWCTANGRKPESAPNFKAALLQVVADLTTNSEDEILIGNRKFTHGCSWFGVRLKSHYESTGVQDDSEPF